MNEIVDGKTHLARIDSAPTDGLEGVEDSLAYRVHNIEAHFHSLGRWLGKLAVQTADAWADETLTPYQAISGLNVYGADADDEAKVLGTDDTPLMSGMVKFDPHEFLIVGVSVDTVYRLRIVHGTGTMAAAVSAGQYSEVMVKFDSANPQQSAGIPFQVKIPRLDCGSDKVWVQAWNATDNATIDFFVGVHEYVG